VIGVGTIAATGQLQQLRSLPHTAAALDAFMRIELITLVVALVVSVALVGRMARSLATRSNDVFDAFMRIFELCFPRLDTAIQGLANGDLTARYIPACKPIPVHGNDEITKIAVLHNRILTATLKRLCGAVCAAAVSARNKTAAASNNTRRQYPSGFFNNHPDVVDSRFREKYERSHQRRREQLYRLG
jgi:methyl-accepting chemotaxis protein